MWWFLKRLGLVALCVGCGLWVGNSSVLIGPSDQNSPRIIAHRGVHHIYVGSDRSAESCHAAPVAPITHDFIENTMPSIQEAFRLGADVVELDVHLTRDDVFAVIHDWTVDCRTDGQGITHEQAFADLLTLDLGYRIDDGNGTFPLRGHGIGLMPNLEEVLNADIAGQILINFKSRRSEDGIALANLLEATQQHARVFGVYGGQEPTQTAIDLVPDLRGFDRASLKACLVPYLAFGWTGHVPAACQNTIIVVPQNYAPYLWGWPHRFTRRLGRAGTNVILVGPSDGSGFISGIDDAEALNNVPAHFDGYIWTDRIELIGPRLSAGHKT